jgi:hypothetical protein
MLRLTFGRNKEMLRCGSWDDGLFGDLGGKPCPRQKREEREAPVNVWKMWGISMNFPLLMGKLGDF